MKLFSSPECFIQCGKIHFSAYASNNPHIEPTWGQLEVPEHISDIIFAFQALFDSPQHEKAMETAKIAVFRPFGAYKA